jgi:hypothetical protein
MKTAFLIVLTICALGTVRAQESVIVSYPIAFPVGNLHSYSTNVSFRGVSVEFLQKVAPHFQSGLEAGWNVFYQAKPSQAYHDGATTITGSQYRYTNVAPILAGTKYYPLSSKIAKPFIGFGIGTLYANRSTDFGIYRIRDDAWQFCMRPELGLEVYAGHGVSGFLAAKYYWSLNAHDLDGQQFVSINIGLKLSTF